MGVVPTTKEKEVNAAVCDASLLFKLIVAEADSEEAVSLVRSVRVTVPDFAFLEIGNALWSRIRRREIDFREAKSSADDIRELVFQTLQSGPFVDRALEIASSIGHPIYDCLYLAIAEDLAIPLLTADRRLTSAVRRAGFRGVHVNLLSELHQ
jgi:predicted nucleic acid-binding protein